MSHTHTAPVDCRTEVVHAARPALQRIADCWMRALRGVVSLSLCDQAVVSGASFLTTVLIGRVCGPEELGRYSLGLSLALFVVTIQQSLVTAPYTVYCRRTVPEAQRRYAGSVLLHSLVLGVMTLLALAAWSAAASLGVVQTPLGGAAWVLCVTIPFLLLRDFARGFCYAHLRVRSALLVDAGVAGCQLAVLSVLVLTGRLTSLTAFAAAGIGAMVGAAGWLSLCRRQFAPRWRAAAADLRKSWSFGKWVFAGQSLSSLNSDVFLVWLLAVLVGPQATGIFAACLTVVFFSNPFVLAVAQILTPRLAESFAAGGVEGLGRAARRADLLIAGVMGLFCVGVAFLGGSVLQLMYGAAYGHHHDTVVAAALAVFAATIGMGAGKGLWVLDRPDLDFAARSVGLTVTAVAASALVLPFGVTGVAWGWCIGNAAETAARHAVFSRLIRSELRLQEAL